MQELEGRVDFYRGPGERSKFRGFVRMSPNLFRRPDDGALIVSLLRTAKERKPIPVDPKKLQYRPLFKADRRKGKSTVPTVVSVPEPEEEPADDW